MSKINKTLNKYDCMYKEISARQPNDKQTYPDGVTNHSLQFTSRDDYSLLAS